MTDISGAIKSVQCRAELKAVREKYGYSVFRTMVYKLERERLLVDPREREKRKRFKPSAYRFLYQRQRGICPLCRLAMVQPRYWPGELEIDHIDPNRDDFGTDSNLQLTHKSCNRSKGGKSLEEQSKSNGKTFAEIVRIPVNEEEEP